LRYFVLTQIGFVFSTWVFNPPAQVWGLNEIGFELALFFRRTKQQKSS